MRCSGHASGAGSGSGRTVAAATAVPPIADRRCHAEGGGWVVRYRFQSNCVISHDMFVDIYIYKIASTNDHTLYIPITHHANRNWLSECIHMTGVLEGGGCDVIGRHICAACESRIFS